MWLGKEDEARAMTVPQSVFTVPSLLEFSSSIPFTAAELLPCPVLTRLPLALGWREWWALFDSCSADACIAGGKKDRFPMDLGKGISILGEAEVPSPQWHLQGVG